MIWAFLYLTGILIAFQKQGVRAISTAFLIPSKNFLGQAQNLSLIINKVPMLWQQYYIQG